MPDTVDRSTSTFQSTITSPNAPPVLTQDFDADGNPYARPADKEEQVASNQEASENGENISVDDSTSSDETIVTEDTAALKQKGYLHEKGFSGDQSLSNAETAFFAAASSAAAFFPTSRSLSQRSESGRLVRNKTDNFYLYDSEKRLLEKRAAEFASYGIVPYDALEEFLYIIVSLPEYSDLAYISAVVGIEELDDRLLVREPAKILNLQNLYKIGYLANAVKVIDSQYDPKFNVNNATDSGSSNFGALLGAAAAGVSLLQIPALQTVSDLVGDCVGQIADTAAITSAFSSFGGLGSIAQLTNVASQMTSLALTVNSTASILSKTGMRGVAPIAAAMQNLNRRTRNVSNYCTQVSALTAVAATSGKTADIAKQMIKINTMVGDLSTVASTVNNLIGGVAAPGDIGATLGVMIRRSGGYAPNPLLTEMVGGQRIPPSVLYNNPMMAAPSYVGKAFFGESMAARAAMDQVFCRRIGAYPHAQSGSGAVSFGFQNFGSYGGSTSIASMVSRMTLGVATPPTTGALATMVAAKTTQVCNILNVSPTVPFEPRRSDNSMPFLVAMGAALVDDTRSPFSADVHHDGWKRSCSVGNDVQRYQPTFIDIVRTSL